jgi:Reductase C-terminal
VHRPLGDKAMLMLETDGAHLVYALGINAQRDLAAVRRLIERRVAVDPDELADPAKPFAAMLKARA